LTFASTRPRGVVEEQLRDVDRERVGVVAGGVPEQPNFRDKVERLGRCGLDVRVHGDGLVGFDVERSDQRNIDSNVDFADSPGQGDVSDVDLGITGDDGLV